VPTSRTDSEMSWSNQQLTVSHVDVGENPYDVSVFPIAPTPDAPYAAMCTASPVPCTAMGQIQKERGMVIQAEVLDRIRGEYDEMPGLRLTLQQAARFWQMERTVCEAALDTLVQQRCLNRTIEGAYVALLNPRRPLKVSPTGVALRRFA
jgi:hypothetical protein